MSIIIMSSYAEYEQDRNKQHTNTIYNYMTKLNKTPTQPNRKRLITRPTTPEPHLKRTKSEYF